MKPRLESAPWTAEDADILWRMLSVSDYLMRCRTRGIYVSQDRRDAYNMWRWRMDTNLSKSLGKPHWYLLANDLLIEARL